MGLLAQASEPSHLTLYSGRPWLALRPRLLVGQPGCGNSHLAKRLGELDFCGISDSRTIEGMAHGRTVAQPCYRAIGMRQAKAANPLVLLEEANKSGGSERKGPPLAVLRRLFGARRSAKRLAREVELALAAVVPMIVRPVQ